MLRQCTTGRMGGVYWVWVCVSHNQKVGCSWIRETKGWYAVFLNNCIPVGSKWIFEIAGAIGCRAEAGKFNPKILNGFAEVRSTTPSQPFIIKQSDELIL